MTRRSPQAAPAHARAGTGPVWTADDDGVAPHATTGPPEGRRIAVKDNLDPFARGLVGTRLRCGEVARGLVDAALGTDTAGSGRIAAAFNNIVGLEPTRVELSDGSTVQGFLCESSAAVGAQGIGHHDGWHADPSCRAGR